MVLWKVNKLVTNPYWFVNGQLCWDGRLQVTEAIHGCWSFTTGLGSPLHLWPRNSWCSQHFYIFTKCEINGHANGLTGPGGFFHLISQTPKIPSSLTWPNVLIDLWASFGGFCWTFLPLKMWFGPVRVASGVTGLLISSHTVFSFCLLTTGMRSCILLSERSK